MNFLTTTLNSSFKLMDFKIISLYISNNSIKLYQMLITIILSFNSKFNNLMRTMSLFYLKFPILRIGYFYNYFFNNRYKYL